MFSPKYCTYGTPKLYNALEKFIDTGKNSGISFNYSWFSFHTANKMHLKYSQAIPNQAIIENIGLISSIERNILNLLPMHFTFADLVETWKKTFPAILRSKYSRKRDDIHHQIWEKKGKQEYFCSPRILIWWQLN